MSLKQRFNRLLDEIAVPVRVTDKYSRAYDASSFGSVDYSERFLLYR